MYIPVHTYIQTYIHTYKQCYIKTSDKGPFP